MKRLLFVLFAALALTAGIGTANAHDRVSFALSYGGYYAPRPVYWESRPYWEAPPAYVASGPVYVERHYYRPRVYPARVCPRHYHYVPGHYSYRWQHWRGGHCARNW